MDTLTNFIINATNNSIEASSDKMTYKKMNEIRVNKGIEICSLLTEYGADVMVKCFNCSLPDGKKLKIEDLTIENIQRSVDFFGV